MRLDIRASRTVERVDAGGGLLENAERLDQGRGHALSVASNVEVDKRALGLSTPVAVVGDLERAERVGLGTESSSRLASHSNGRGEGQSKEHSRAGCQCAIVTGRALTNVVHTMTVDEEKRRAEETAKRALGSCDGEGREGERAERHRRGVGRVGRNAAGEHIRRREKARQRPCWPGTSKDKDGPFVRTTRGCG